MNKLRHYFTRVTSSSLAKSSGIYTISSFINASIPIILLPILTRKLSPADYGIVAMFQLTVAIVYPFIGMNLEGAIQRRYFDKNENGFPSYIGACFILVFFSLVVISVIFWAFIGNLVEITQIPKTWLRYIILVVFCQYTITVLLNLFQVRVEPIKFGIVQIMQTLLNVGLTIILVAYFNRNFGGRLEAQIISSVFTAIICMSILIWSKQIRFELLKKDVIHALKFGVPLIPHAIGGMFFTAIDRYFLTNLVGLEQTGNYTVAFQIGTVVNLVTIAFNNAYIPWLFENLNKNDPAIKKKIVKFTYLYFILLTFAALILLLLFPFIVHIFVGNTFRTINTYSTLIVLGFVFQGFYFMVTNYIMYAQKTHVQAAVTLSIGLLKLPITYFLIIWLGAVGASASFCISFFIFFVVTWILSAKVYPMPWNVLNLIRAR